MITKAALLLSFFVLPGCANDKPSEQVATEPQQDERAGRNDFAVWAEDYEIPLRAWNTALKLDSVLGPADTVSSKVLGEGADTHRGATIRTAFYKGATIDWYIPKGKDSGWIMQVTVVGSAYETARGIRVGDRASQMQQQYADGYIFPDGRKQDDEYAWIISKDNDYLKFEISDSLVSMIEVYHEIP